MSLKVICTYSLTFLLFLFDFSSSFPFTFQFISNIPVISLVIPLPEMLFLWCTQPLRPIYYSCLAWLFYKSMSQRITFTPIPTLKLYFFHWISAVWITLPCWHSLSWNESCFTVSSSYFRVLSAIQMLAACLKVISDVNVLTPFDSQGINVVVK